MSRSALARKANRAIFLVDSGTDEQIEAFEDAEGAALSTVLDDLWDLAEETGNVSLSERLERAFNRLTG